VREAVQEVVDIQMETLTEKVKELQMSINDLKEKMHGLNEDQWAFRKQQLLGTQNSSERARRQIVERRMRSWLAIRCYSIAESFLPYMAYSKCRNRSRWLLYVPRDQAWRIIPNVSRHTPAVMNENSVGQMVQRQLRHAKDRSALLQGWPTHKFDNQNETTGGTVGQNARRAPENLHESYGPCSGQWHVATGHVQTKTMVATHYRI
jgi:FtsZ-binding cell division protein ZapB